MFLYGTYSLTHSHTGKVLGALLCLEEGKAMQGDGMVRSPHNHHLVWRERAGLGSPLCTPQSRELKASGGFCLSCPQHGVGSALFHCGPVLGTARDSA